MTSPFNKGLSNGLVGDNDDNDDSDDEEDDNDNEKDELWSETNNEKKRENAKLDVVDDKAEEKIVVKHSSSFRNTGGAGYSRDHALVNGWSENTELSLSDCGQPKNEQNARGSSSQTILSKGDGKQNYKNNHIVKNAETHKIEELDSLPQNFISETKSFQNFDGVSGCDDERRTSGTSFQKSGSTKDVKQNGDNDDGFLLCSLSVGKIDSGDRLGGLISRMEDREDYVNNYAGSEENLSHDDPINNGDSVIRNGNLQGKDRVVEIDNAVHGEMEKRQDDTGTLENRADRIDDVSVYDDVKDSGFSGSSGAGDMADAFGDVTKTCLAPLSKSQGDNPGHVFYGNDDDNDDNNSDENKYYVPLKAAIAPVRIDNLDGEKKGDGSKENAAGPSGKQEELNADKSVERGECRDTESVDEFIDRDIQASGCRIDDKNSADSSYFGDFPEDHRGNIGDQGGENFNENSKQSEVKPDNLSAGDESQIPSSSTSVPVPFSQALNYRRRMQCPNAPEQEGEPLESVGEGHGNKGGHDDLDQSTLNEGGTDLSCENDKTLTCALKTVTSAAAVTYSEHDGDNTTRDIQQGDSHHQENVVGDHVTLSEETQNQTQTLVAAEASVHNPEHASERKDKKNNFSSNPAEAKNESHIVATMASANGSSGLQNFSLSGMLPFSERKRLVSEEHEVAAIDRAFEDFNLAAFDEEDSDEQEENAGGKKKVKITDYEDRRSANIRVADPSDVLVVDIVDAGYRRKSVAESAQDWLVDWTEKNGTKEWMQPLHERLELYRQKVLTQKTVKASGFVILKNTKRKRVQQLQNWWDNVTYTLALWGKSIRRIEGVHGSGVASYFLFLRWLFGLNIVLFAFMVSFTTIPMAILDEDSLEPSTDTAINTSYYCSEAYVVEKGSGVVAALEFIQGTGWMEKTYLFYGYYVHALQATYNLPLAYMLTVLACLVISLVLMARYTGKSFREALLNAANTNFEYSNKVFGAWDYGLTDLHAAEQKQKGIHNDIQGDMLEQSFMRKRIERLEKRCSRCKLYTLRLIINFFILVFLGAAAYLIYFVTSWSTEYAEENKEATGTDAWLLLLVQYLPSLTITICNVVLPLVFEKVVVLEDYSQAFVIQITLIRTVFLRLASLIVLVISLFSEISCTPKDSCNANIGSDCTEIKCWETYVGQQFYKLAIMDFLVAVIKVFFVELPRRFAASKCDCGLIKALGPPEFNIPANVLDLVYGQCLVWLGFLFCPLLPGLNIAKLCIFFYVKKLSALVACPPTDRPYKASRIHIFFMVILLVAFSLCALPVMYSVFAIEPSKGCGPFLLFSSMNQALERAVDTWPSALNITYDFLTSAAVTTIVIIFLAVAVYYLRSIGKAHKQQAALYREQLIMEGRDKQFLMSKLQEMYMPGQKGKQADKDKKPKKTDRKDTENVAMVDERGGYPSNNPPGNPYSPPNAPVDNQGGDW